MPYRSIRAYTEVGEWDLDDNWLRVPEVIDSVRYTGLVDSKGQEIVGVPERIGFLHYMENQEVEEKSNAVQEGPVGEPEGRLRTKAVR